MSPDAAAPTPRRPTLGRPVVIAWILLYLLLMAHGGWHWAGRSLPWWAVTAPARLPPLNICAAGWAKSCKHARFIWANPSGP